MGHHVERADADMGGIETLRAMFDLFFFAFDSRLDGYGKRTGRKPGPDTLEPVILAYYDYAKTITPAKFMAAMGAANVARRKLGAFYSKYDIWLSPTTAGVSVPWGTYNLSKPGLTFDRVDRGAVRPTLPVHDPAQHHGHARRLDAAGHALFGSTDRRAAGGPSRRRASADPARGRPRAGHAVEGPRAAAACVEGVRGAFAHAESRYSSMGGLSYNRQLSLTKLQNG